MNDEQKSKLADLLAKASEAVAGIQGGSPRYQHFWTLEVLKYLAEIVEILADVETEEAVKHDCYLCQRGIAD